VAGRLDAIVAGRSARGGSPRGGWRRGGSLHAFCDAPVLRRRR